MTILEFCKLINKPNMDNGDVYECLVYAWMKKAGFCIEEQVLYFTPKDFPYGSKDNNLVYIALRYLCRRTFIKSVSGCIFGYFRRMGIFKLPILGI